MIKLPLDDNGHAISILKPLSTVKFSLTSSPVEILSSDSGSYRAIRLFTVSSGVKVGVGATENAHMPLMKEVAETVKLEPKSRLFASGTGSLYVTIMN